ncbi:MAG: methyltransferase domain-containing protein [Fibrobacter sp.]|jgi:SAM-dependent methyltransferase|nr:methyltransferase domain-containing protein [Fibrobacter sp.]
MKEMTVEVACPLCNEDSNYPYRFEQRFVNKESVSLGLNNCKKCNLQYISPRLNQEAISTLYNEDYLTKTVSGANHVDQTVSIKEYQKFKSYLLKTLPEGGHILDVGCGVGNMLKQIKDSQQFKGSGIEISHDAAERARKDGFEIIEENCAKPLAIGNFAARMFKNAMYLFVKTLSVLGYNIGGIHIIARKN